MRGISLDRSGFCAIEDLGWTNGSFVNGLRVSRPQTLSVGDTIEVGGTTLVVRELPIPASERSLKAVPPQPTQPPGRQPAPVPASQATPLAASGRSDRALGSDQPAAPRTSGSRLPSPRPSPRPTRRPTPSSTPGGRSLSLKLHIDFSAGKATVAVDDGKDPLQLEFDGDAWRPASSA